VKCPHCGVENGQSSGFCVTCGHQYEKGGETHEAAIGRTGKAVIVVLVAAAIVTFSLGLAGSIAINQPSVILEDADEPDIPDDYDAVLLEGNLERSAYVITLSVAGEVQLGYYYDIIPMCSYRVGVWVKETGDSSFYVFDLLYAEGEEQHYGVPATRQGNTLTFEFPLAYLRPNAYIVDLDAMVNGEDGDSMTIDIVGESPPYDATIAHLLTLPFSPYILFVITAISAVITTAFLVSRVIHL